MKIHEPQGLLRIFACPQFVHDQPVLFRCCLIFCPEVEFAKAAMGPISRRESAFLKALGKSLRNCLCAKRAGQVERLCQLRQILGNTKTKRKPMDAAANKAELVCQSSVIDRRLAPEPGD
ncbi:hypothetical protein [Rhizobium leguminosarum]|uniref:Uncharacterized protein n=1 Tax=Rhizobium leguminosarum TaxID=384 RepID=A0A7K3VSY6_RHILE|nr:hypothetical protein [Rhizobium leguminosarum]NEK20295.1 hypothetical protein [Rhizobium leguminosarum]